MNSVNRDLKKNPIDLLKNVALGDLKESAFKSGTTQPAVWYTEPTNQR